MVTRESPKRLSDVANLFLSQNKTVEIPGRRHVEASLWLVVSTKRLCRAFIASGVASAFAAENMNVTVLEVGEGLPNIGYYFALEPRDYIAPTLDDRVALTGTYGGSVRYVYAVRPDTLHESEACSGTPAFPHIAISAFYLNRSIELDSYVRTMQRCTSRMMLRNKKTSEPDAVVLFDDDGTSRLAAEFFARLGGINSNAVRFYAACSTHGAPSGLIDEYIQVPGGIQLSIVRRNPPTGVFFSDLASSVLQMLSYRRKRMNRDAASR